jgi:phosphoribosylformylglycinamidine (FGAM) synthase PurS component
MVELEAENGADLDRLCEQLLANPLIEDFEVEQMPDTSSASRPGVSGSDPG